MLVLDTSAILSGLYFGTDIATVPKAVAEILPKSHSFHLLETMLSVGLEVVTPSEESRTRVRKVAERTGDTAHLSDADIDALSSPSISMPRC